MKLFKIVLAALFVACGSAVHAGIINENTKENLKILAVALAAGIPTNIACDSYLKPEILSSAKSFLSYLCNPTAIPFSQRLLIAPIAGAATAVAVTLYMDYLAKCNLEKHRAFNAALVEGLAQK